MGEECDKDYCSIFSLTRAGICVHCCSLASSRVGGQGESLKIYSCLKEKIKNQGRSREALTAHTLLGTIIFFFHFVFILCLRVHQCLNTQRALPHRTTAAKEKKRKEKKHFCFEYKLQVVYGIYIELPRARALQAPAQL